MYDRVGACNASLFMRSETYKDKINKCWERNLDNATGLLVRAVHSSMDNIYPMIDN